ncbi:MAG: carboxypeptidase-like regulatory domain-containing protein, partial [Planctomycetota bacterium]|nr:carboxypeptidase-like regulatory domain-containing protein [Planctomycetota bacterium]
HTMLHGVRVPRPTRAVMSTYTDSGGNFGFRQFEPGTYRLRVTHPRYAAHQGEPIALPLPDPSQKHPLKLGTGAALEGQVRSPQGKPVGSVPVVLSSTECRPRSTWTDQQGRYSFTGLPTTTEIRIAVGKSSLPAAGRAAGWSGRGKSASHPEQILQLSPGERRLINLTTDSPREDGGLAGKVSLDGKPFVTPLELLSLPEMGHSPEFSSDESGNFSFAALPPGRYRLSGRGFPFAEELDVAAGKTTELSVSLQTLVYDLEIASAANGDPISSPCTITAELLNPTAAQKNGAPWTKRTILAPGGNILIDGLFPLAYRLRIETPGHVPASVKINPAKNPRGRASLRRGKKTRLDLKKPNGEIFTGNVSVVIFEDTGGVIHDEKIHVSGELELPALPPGTYQVEVRTRKKPYRMTLEISGS